MRFSTAFLALICLPAAAVSERTIADAPAVVAESPADESTTKREWNLRNRDSNPRVGFQSAIEKLGEAGVLENLFKDVPNEAIANLFAEENMARINEVSMAVAANRENRESMIGALFQERQKITDLFASVIGEETPAAAADEDGFFQKMLDGANQQMQDMQDTEVEGQQDGAPGAPTQGDIQDALILSFLWVLPHVFKLGLSTIPLFFATFFGFITRVDDNVDIGEIIDVIDGGTE